MSETSTNFSFTPYQKFMVAILAIMQFTVVLDFMVLSPLGALLLEKLNINTQQFGLVVSAYAFSAGASGLLAAGFAVLFLADTFTLADWVGLTALIDFFFEGLLTTLETAFLVGLVDFEVSAFVLEDVPFAFLASIGFLAFFEADFDFVGFTFFTL